MRRHAAGAALVTLLVCGCSSEVGLGLSEVAAPGATCVPASAEAVNAVERAMAPHTGRLVSATMVEIPAADRGFGEYPAYVIGARYVSLDQVSDVGTWSLSGSNGFGPVFPLDEVARQLTNPDAFLDDTFYAEHLASWGGLRQTSKARDCATAGPGS